MEREDLSESWVLLSETSREAPDQADSTPETSMTDAEQRAPGAQNSEEQPLSNRVQEVITPNASLESNYADQSTDAQVQVGSLEHDFANPANVYAPQAQNLVLPRYQNPTDEWEEYPRNSRFDVLDTRPVVIWQENPSLQFNAGYENIPQMPYVAYYPVTTPPQPLFFGDGQFYSPQNYPFSGHLYQLTVPLVIPYINSQSPMSPTGTMNSSSSIPGSRQDYLPYDWQESSDGTRLLAPAASLSVASSSSGADNASAAKQGPQICAPGSSGQCTVPLNAGAQVSGIGESNPGLGTRDESPNFVTGYKDAKFFVIKSYNKDDVQASIKYGVWTSSVNGNKKLDSAYREAKEQEDPCPVLLFFSVNASKNFCGVAEMMGPVDFENSVNYWQFDWSGHFPVKWHVLKDVPNHQFRRIILENNGNKPVTLSRDAQEVKLEQGLEMLSIFKNHKANTSILDDFHLYEKEKMGLENTARLQHSVANEPHTPTAAQVVPMREISESFSHAVRLEEINTTGSPSDRTLPGDASATIAEPEEPINSDIS
ncbi:uncharacterized protein [Typha latifolia]|uniref:uncharacterized protein n=1 Tax=Typha latifolia TaxID=4733 RepID=UPI003C2E5D0F